jgi:acetyl esterase/lipase
MKKIATLLLFFFFIITMSYAQATFPLWQNGAPDALGKEDKDNPTLTFYPPDSGKANGAAIVICPGGGYHHLAKHEGEDYAKFFSMHGVASLVLKYRLGADGYRHPAMLNDASRAIRIVRTEAAKWKINPGKIGIIGSSAGGHLASTLLTHFDLGNKASSDPVERVSSRPDFGILCYPVISMGEITHSGSKNNLLGDNPSPELVELLSNEKHVSKDMPPCFIWHTSEDGVVSVQNSIEFAHALAKNNVPFDLHIYQQGRHGFGLVDKYPFTNAHPWTKDLLLWLKVQGIIISQ